MVEEEKLTNLSPQSAIWGIFHHGGSQGKRAGRQGRAGRNDGCDLNSGSFISLSIAAGPTTASADPSTLSTPSGGLSPLRQKIRH